MVSAAPDVIGDLSVIQNLFGGQSEPAKSLYVKNGAAEATQTWNVDADYGLVYVRTVSNTQIIISRSAGWTLSNYNTVGVHPLNEFITVGGTSDQFLFNWPVHSGDVIYFRMAASAEFMLYIIPLTRVSNTTTEPLQTN